MLQEVSTTMPKEEKRPKDVHAAQLRRRISPSEEVTSKEIPPAHAIKPPHGIKEETVPMEEAKLTEEVQEELSESSCTEESTDFMYANSDTSDEVAYASSARIPSKSQGVALPRLDSSLRTFVINLKRRTDRRACVETLCQQLGVNYEIVEAIDGQALRVQPGARFELQEGKEAQARVRVDRTASTARPQGWGNLKIRKFRTRWVEDGRERQQLLKMAEHRLATSALTVYGHELWGAVGCSLSHQRVLQRLLDEGLEWALVLEDDATLAMPADRVQDIFNMEMQRIAQERDGWSLVYLGGHMSTKHRMRNLGSACCNRRVGQSLVEVSEIYQTHAYLIHRSLVPEILRLLQEGFAADAAFVSWSRLRSVRSGETHCFLFDPALIVQPGGSDRWKDSDIFVEGEFFKRLAGEYTLEGRRKRSKPPKPKMIARGPSGTSPGVSEAAGSEAAATGADSVCPTKAKPRKVKGACFETNGQACASQSSQSRPPQVAPASQDCPSESSQSRAPQVARASRACPSKSTQSRAPQESWNQRKVKAMEAVTEVFQEQSVPMLGVPSHKQSAALDHLLNFQASTKNSRKIVKLHRLLHFIQTTAKSVCCRCRRHLNVIASEITPYRVLQSVKALQRAEGVVQQLSSQELCRLAAIVRALLQHVCSMPASLAKEVEAALAITPDLRTILHKSSFTRAILELELARSAVASDRQAARETLAKGAAVFVFQEADLLLSISGELEAKELLLEKVRVAIVMVENLAPVTRHVRSPQASTDGARPLASQRLRGWPTAALGTSLTSSWGNARGAAPKGKQVGQDVGKSEIGTEGATMDPTAGASNKNKASKFKNDSATARTAATAPRIAGKAAPKPKRSAAAKKAGTAQRRGPGRPPKEPSTPLSGPSQPPGPGRPPKEPSLPPSGPIRGSQPQTTGGTPRAQDATPGNTPSASAQARQRHAQQRGPKRPASVSLRGVVRRAELRRELFSLTNGRLRKKARYLGVPLLDLNGVEKNDIVERVINIEMSKS